MSISGPFDHGFTPEYYQVGKFTDPWGSVWTNMQAGIIGEVKEPVFADYEKMEGYEAPVAQFLTEWEEARNGIAEQIARAREADKFVIGGWISLFERMQYLRGTEDLYCDIALEEEEMFRMIKLVMQYMHVYVKKWLEMDIDAMAFGDDWGTQISLLISPDTWRKIFKPLYKELIDMIKAAGKKVFFHSDGYILELYPEFIELGVDAINSQLWCMGVEKVAERFAGKITFWGEISRQQTLPFGTPEDKQYPSCVKSWEENWPVLSTFFEYPVEIRKIIYTTNIIEGLNRQFRQITKNKPSFTNDDSLKEYCIPGSNEIRVYNTLYVSGGPVIRPLF